MGCEDRNFRERNKPLIKIGFSVLAVSCWPLALSKNSLATFPSYQGRARDGVQRKTCKQLLQMFQKTSPATFPSY
jgi:hypothetical protein